MGAKIIALRASRPWPESCPFRRWPREGAKITARCAKLGLGDPEKVESRCAPPSHPPPAAAAALPAPQANIDWRLAFCYGAPQSNPSVDAVWAYRPGEPRPAEEVRRQTISTSDARGVAPGDIRGRCRADTRSPLRADEYPHPPLRRVLGATSRASDADAHWRRKDAVREAYFEVPPTFSTGEKMPIPCSSCRALVATARFASKIWPAFFRRKRQREGGGWPKESGGVTSTVTLAFIASGAACPALPRNARFLSGAYRVAAPGPAPPLVPSCPPPDPRPTGSRSKARRWTGSRRTARGSGRPARRSQGPG